MLLLNEPGQFNWQVIYKLMNSNMQVGETVICGGAYDFIPRKNEYVALDNIVYLINDVVYDFDMSTIFIYLFDTDKTNVRD